MLLTVFNRHASILTVVAAAIIYLSAAGFYVERGKANADEGFYAYASYSVMHGKIPYRDFAYTQMPVLPYLQGALMSFTGFGVRQQRWINACLGALSLALGVVVWRKSRLHPAVCWALVLAWCFCKPLLYYDTIGKTYAMSQLLLVAAGGCLLLNTSPQRKLLLLSLAGVLAIGCRLTVIPCVFVLWCGLAALHRQQLSWTLLFGVPLSIALIILGPFFAAAPANALFWNWTYHRQSMISPERWELLANSFTMLPAMAMLAVLGTIILFCKKQGPAEPGAWLFLAGFAGWILSISVAGIYVDYAVPCLPLMIVGIGLLLHDITPFRFEMALGSVALTMIVALSMLHGESFIKKGYLEAINHVAAYLKANTKPTDIVLASMPEIPLEANRPILPGTEMGKFAITNEMDDATAQSRNIITFGQLLSIIDRRSASIVILSESHAWNFSWSIPGLRTFSADFYLQFSTLLLQRYDCVGANKEFLVFKVHDPQNKVMKIDAHNM